MAVASDVLHSQHQSVVQRTMVRTRRDEAAIIPPDPRMLGTRFLYKIRPTSEWGTRFLYSTEGVIGSQIGSYEGQLLTYFDAWRLLYEFGPHATLRFGFYFEAVETTEAAVESTI